MPTRECYHCKQLIEVGEPHDCWTTTEAALTQDLSEDLQEAWERLRETAAELGEQRIYASHSSIMFSRKSCYFFVRPKKSFLEVCIFLGRAGEGAADSPRRADVEDQARAPHPGAPPRRSRGAADRLAAGGLSGPRESQESRGRQECQKCQGRHKCTSRGQELARVPDGEEGHESEALDKRPAHGRIIALPLADTCNRRSSGPPASCDA